MSGEDSAEESGTQLAAAGARDGDSGATRGGARSSFAAQEIAGTPGLVAPADEPDPTTTTTAPPTTTTAPPTTQAPTTEAPQEKEEPKSSSASSSSSSSGGATSTKASGGDVWEKLAKCESGGNAGANTGNGFYGAFQFTSSTWKGVGGSGLPHQHSYETQKQFAQKLQARSGWGQWPHCTSKLGLR